MLSRKSTVLVTAQLNKIELRLSVDLKKVLLTSELCPNVPFAEFMEDNFAVDKRFSTTNLITTNYKNG